MGDSNNSKRPVVPQGLKAHTNQLAVREEVSRGRSPKSRFVFGLIWCFIGSAFVVSAPVLANVLIAFGATIAVTNGGTRERVITLSAALAVGTLCTYLLFGAYNVPMAVIAIVCACGIADAYVRDRVNAGSLLLVAASVTWAMLGTDMVSTSLQGTSIAELITSEVDAVVESNVGSLDLDGTAALLEARDSMVSYWPTLYFVVGLSMVVCSVLGSWLGVRTGGGSSKDLIVRYDVPLWVAELFALGVAAQLLGPLLPNWQDEVSTIGANVVMCTRIALAQQGLSVLQWWMRERRAKWSMRTLVVMLAVWLELSFALASVVGLLDVAVNFRHIERGRPDLLPRPRQEQ